MSSVFQAYFSQPMVAAAVIVHLVTDGTYYGDQKQETISVQLLDTKDLSHDLGEHVPLGMACSWCLLLCLPMGGCEDWLKMSSSLFPLSRFYLAFWLPSNEDVFVYPEKSGSGRFGDKRSMSKSSLQSFPSARHL